MQSTMLFGIVGAIDVNRLLVEAVDVEWLVPGVLPASCVIIAAAAPKSGKSLLAMSLGLEVARGEEFLGRQTTRRRVVYVFLEDGRGRAARRFRQLGLTEEDDIEFFALFEPAQIQSLLDAVEEAPEPLLVIIDPLIVMESQFGVKDENVALEIEKLFARLRSVVQKSRSTILLIHHFRKAGDVMRGSVALQGSSDGWWLLKREERSAVVKVSVTLRDAEDTEFAFEMVKDGDALRFEHRTLDGGSSAKPRANPLRESVHSLLLDRSPVALSQADIASELSVKRGAVQSALTALEKSGYVTRPNGPKGGYVAHPAPLLEVEEFDA